MKLSDDQALARLSGHDHAVLSTLHEVRGIDSVPVVYAVADGHIAVPVDRVKPKTSTRLQRERNLEVDDRATLLAEHWDGDQWSNLWWVRAHLRSLPNADAARTESLENQLADRYWQYADRPFARLLVFEIVDLAGWAASDPAGGLP